ncbi:hypothetical protein [Actinomadura sp. WMMB 499]|uniref:hypothetical protein n=1 Tax=Actinomadura sp. WMMB 499 TaxID=1219491 RepID=UPI0012460FF6|nr:hypothetical protein [Actinomadura sp. WMMB 499]QFG22770.1 hypothetical protein F7P10_18240 [Actinomadura sp. WMMB 499]
MSNVAEGPYPGWLERDPEYVQAELARRFPGVPSWFGEWTGSWWAMVGDRLLEAASPFVLADMIRTAVAANRPPRPAPPRPPVPRPRPAPPRPAGAGPAGARSRRPPGRPGGRGAGPAPGHFLGRLRGRFAPAGLAR